VRAQCVLILARGECDYVRIVSCIPVLHHVAFVAPMRRRSDTTRHGDMRVVRRWTSAVEKADKAFPLLAIADHGGCKIASF
jgi:hypothetical protein